MWCLDLQHAQDFFELIEKEWLNPKTRPLVEKGLKLGVYIFDRLYSDLCR